MYGEGLYGNRFPDDPAWPILLLLGSKENVLESQSPVKRLSFPNAWFVVLCVHAQAHTHTQVSVHSTLESPPPTIPLLVTTAYIRPCSQVPFPSTQSRGPPPPWSAMPDAASLLSANTVCTPHSWVHSWVQTPVLFCFFAHKHSRVGWGIKEQKHLLYWHPEALPLFQSWQQCPF